MTAQRHVLHVPTAKCSRTQARRHAQRVLPASMTTAMRYVSHVRQVRCSLCRVNLHVLHANQVSSVFRRPKVALPALLAKSNLYVCRRLALCVALAFTMTACGGKDARSETPSPALTALSPQAEAQERRRPSAIHATAAPLTPPSAFSLRLYIRLVFEADLKNVG